MTRPPKPVSLPVEDEVHQFRGNWSRSAHRPLSSDTGAWRVLSSTHSPSDDAAAPPHQGNATIVEGPTKFNGGLSQQHKALSIRDDLGSIEGLKNDTKTLIRVAVGKVTACAY